MAGITMEIIKSIAVIGDPDTGYKKELNLVSWNGAEPKIDIRTWSPNGAALKGLTLTESEAKDLYKALGNLFDE